MNGRGDKRKPHPPIPAEVVDAAKKPPYPPYVMPFVTYEARLICLRNRAEMALPPQGGQNNRKIA